MVNSGIMVLTNVQDTTSILIQLYYEHALDMRWKIANEDSEIMSNKQE